MAKEIREKKVEVNIDGRIVRVMPHMVGDMTKFGSTEPRKVVKEPPKELMHPLPKRLLLTKAELPKEELPVEKLSSLKEEFPKEPTLPNEPLNEPPVEPVIKAEKTELPKKVVKKSTKKVKK
jgi:hypothetical protein